MFERVQNTTLKLLVALRYTNAKFALSVLGILELIRQFVFFIKKRPIFNKL